MEELFVTKQEFVDKVAREGEPGAPGRAERRRRHARPITETLKGGGEIAFTGFGKFSTQHRAERRGSIRGIPTEKVTIPASTVPKFSAGSPLKTAVRGR